MSRTMALLLGAVLLMSIAAVTVLIAMGRPVDTLTIFLSGTLIPTAVAAFAAHQASTAASAAKEAVHNTNGRMSEMIQENARLTARLASLDPNASTGDDVPKVDRGVRYAPK